MQSRPRLQGLLVATTLIFILLIDDSSCFSSNNHHQQQQQQQVQRTASIAAANAAAASASEFVSDKQLLRKSLDSLPDSNSLPSSRSNNQNNNNNNNIDQQQQVTNSSASFQCPEQFGYYTDTRDCTKYYVCVFGEVLHESCTGGLRFSRELQTCDWPRNVDCPHGNSSSLQNSANAASQTSVTTTSSSATQLSPFQASTQTTAPINNQQQQQTTTPTSVTSNSQLNRQQFQAKDDLDDSRAINQATGEERPLKGSSAAMVFADEGSDPQQPSFDEAVSPVITPDGTIHLHDGSGGTFSLTPNHNNVQRQPQGRQVDVFVKPITISAQPSSTSPASSRSPNKLQAGPPSSAGRQAQAGPSKLLPATLPNRNSLAQLAASSQAQFQSQPQPSRHLQGDSLFDNQRASGHSQALRLKGDQLEEDELTSNEPQAGDQADSDNQSDSGAAGDQTEAPEGVESGSEESSPQQSGDYIPPMIAQSGPRLAEAASRRQPAGRASDRKPSSDSFWTTPAVLAGEQEGERDSTNRGQAEEENREPQERLVVDQKSLHASLPRPPVRQNHTLLRELAEQQEANSNNRQSRMSNQQQQFVPAQSSTTPQMNAGRFSLPVIDSATAAHLAAAGLSLNNVNFNDSSKLIRLSSSQFESQANQQPQQAYHGQGHHSFFPNQHHHTVHNQIQQPQQQQPQRQQLNKFPLPSSRSHGSLNSQRLAAFAPDSNRGVPEAGSRNQPDSQADNQGAFRPASDNMAGQPLVVSNTLLIPQNQRRARPPKRQQIPSAGNQVRSRLRDFEESSVPTSTVGSTTSSMQPTTSLPPRLSDYNGSDLDEDPVPRAPGRQVVAPTTVNFQQDDFPKPGTGFASTTPATPTTTANRKLSQGQRNAALLAATEAPQPAQQQPSSLDSSPQTPATSQPEQSATQDPALVANRYLNSAIDALEAGQPFGTVDYDFDILNDNSTDRRNTGTSAGQQTRPSNPNSAKLDATDTQAASANPNQRQRQNWLQQTNGGRQSVLSNLGGGRESDGESINLTNGKVQKADGRSLPQHSAAPGRLRASIMVAGNHGGGSQAPETGFQGTQGSGQAPAAGQQQQQPQRSSSLASSSAQQQQVNNSSSSNSGSSSSSTANSNSNNNNNGNNNGNKRARPTNKKINVNHEQALANLRASTEPAKRPEAIFSTPIALQQATKCDTRVCRLPDCKCGDTLTPGGLEPKVIPQVVLLTFDDAVNDLNWEIYEELFTGRTNPNGCPILATFYVSHEWTDYGQVQTLYSRGHEMASHSITHSFGEKFSKSQWFKEVNGQREILNMYGGVKMNDVRGMRAPFLQIGGNKMFEMLYDANFTYDSSMPIFENSPPLWPYTLDYQLNHECMITPCPTKSFPGVWEVGMTMWVDLRGGRCSMGDACSNPADEDGVYEMLMKNFNRHYKSNRAPFGLFYHSAWFNTVHHRRGFLRFMATVNSLPDVWFVTNWQMLQWMRQPTPIAEINSFEPWQCPAKNDRPPACFHPSVCNVKSEHGK